VPGWKQTPVPCPVLPPKASLSARAAEPEAGLCGADGAAGPGGWVWEVRDDDTGCVVLSYPEHDLRFSISCKAGPGPAPRGPRPALPRGPHRPSSLVSA